MAADEAGKKKKVDPKKEAKAAKFAAKQAKLAEQKAKEAAEGPKKEKKAKPAKSAPEAVVYSGATDGSMKDISLPLPSAYSPAYVEAAWYAWWEAQGFFRPEYGEEATEGSFTMVIPPPNVTGVLHIGHALTYAIEDAIVRWHRMKGKRVLWNPGCDHAGIATQVVVEKKLKREKGLTRHDLGREAFVQEVLKWKEEKGGRIYEQQRAMGISVDWERAAFTMDPKMCRAVVEAFVRLHDKGIIYRSNRLVNWSCTLKSAISDIEVEKKELAGRTLLNVPGHSEPVEFGVLVEFAYPVEETEEELVVATTRVETMLGDTGIAVHPQDERYQHLVGKTVRHPFTDRIIPIIADDFVDREFGTGAVKITPAHDHNDYEVGKRRGLEFITCIEDDGTMSACCGDFAGLRRFEARTAVMEALKDKQLYRGKRDNQMVVPICSRSKDVIEPLLKPQWYVATGGMAEKALTATASGQLKIIPENFVRTWDYWMTNIRDWCISRQLWWGHRIPAYFVILPVPSEEATEANNHYWVSGRTEEEAREKAAQRFNLPKENIQLRQDEDVLDTWFSSALFPFSVFGWPDETVDLGRFFPGQLLETGHDILFFWVARMVFFSQELTGRLPFSEVYLHAMVRDAHGQKMSKSKGNVIDPLDVVKGVSLEALQAQLANSNLDAKEVSRAQDCQRRDYPSGIPECGTDALRFALCAYSGAARDINLDVLRIQGYRHFCNKLWNAVKFTLMQLGEGYEAPAKFATSGEESALDSWILSRLADAVAVADAAIAAYDWPRATTAIYNVWLYELCDVYLESLKPVMSGEDEAAKATSRAVLHHTVETALRLIAPFMPFLAEELWQRLTGMRKGQRSAYPASICVAAYPSPADYAPHRNQALEAKVDLAMAIVKAVRSRRADYELTPKTKTSLVVECAEEELHSWLPSYAAFIGTMASGKEVQVRRKGDASVPSQGTSIVPIGERAKVHLLLQGIIDPAKEKDKLSKKIQTQTAALGKLTTAAARPDYEAKVPADVRQANEEKRRGIAAELEHLEEALQSLSTMA